MGVGLVHSEHRELAIAEKSAVQACQAMATMEHLQGASTAASDGNLPPLSFTFQATQLLTPRQLERITIDQPQYVFYS